MEGDQLQARAEKYVEEFLSTPSGWRATCTINANCPADDISIHALRVEGDGSTNAIAPLQVVFLSTPSVWRVTHKPLGVKHVTVISIHALRVEGDSNV